MFVDATPAVKFRTLNVRPPKHKRKTCLRPGSTRFGLELAILETIAKNRYMTIPQLRVALYLKGFTKVQGMHPVTFFKIVQALRENELLDYPMFLEDIRKHGFPFDIFAAGRLAATTLAAHDLDTDGIPSRTDRSNMITDKLGPHTLMGTQFSLTMPLALKSHLQMTFNDVVREDKRLGGTGVSWDETETLPNGKQVSVHYKVNPDMWMSVSYRRFVSLLPIEIDNNTERGRVDKKESQIPMKLRSYNRLMELALMAKKNSDNIPAQVLEYLVRWNLIDVPWFALFVGPTIGRRKGIQKKLTELLDQPPEAHPIHHADRFLFLAQEDYSSRDPERSTLKGISWPPPTFYGYHRILGYFLYQGINQHPTRLQAVMQNSEKVRHRQQAPVKLYHPVRQKTFSF